MLTAPSHAVVCPLLLFRALVCSLSLLMPLCAHCPFSMPLCAHCPFSMPLFDAYKRCSIGYLRADSALEDLLDHANTCPALQGSQNLARQMWKVATIKVSYS